MVATPLVVELPSRGGERKMLLSEMPVGVSKANFRLSPRLMACVRTAEAVVLALVYSLASGPVRRS